ARSLWNGTKSVMTGLMILSPPGVNALCSHPHQRAVARITKAERKPTFSTGGLLVAALAARSWRRARLRLVCRALATKAEAELLEELREAEPGAARTFRLKGRDVKELTKAAKELGLATCREGSTRDLVVYKSGTELLYGPVPYGFDELGLHRVLVAALQRWTPPLHQATHVQASAIPKLLEGRDVCIQAETGSGKTLAYLLPAAHVAVERTYGEDAQDEDLDEEVLAAQAEASEHTKAHAWKEELDDEPSTSVCYRVERTVDPRETRLASRPEKYATPTGKRLHRGDEFMSRSVAGSALGLQFIELADGRGWYPWDRADLAQRFGLTAVQYARGQRVEAKEDIAYSSGDVIKCGQKGTIRRLLPYVGVRWDGLEGVKAIPTPRKMLQDERKVLTTKKKWASCAPDTLILTATRELCEQVADVARTLGSLMPEKVQENWKVAVAVGAPPGVGKRLKRSSEEWPFPKGDERPDVVVSTPEFMGYFFHKKHISLWANIRYIVYDEVDNLVSGTVAKLIERVKVMLLRAQRTEGAKVQTALVSCVMPNQGGKSTRMLIGRWMPHALREAERPDLLHRNHPMVPMKWKYVPEGFDEKVKLLLQHLYTEVGVQKAKGHKYVQQKTLIFCNSTQTAAELAELLATTHNFRKIGIFVKQIGNDERRKRLRLFREGEVTLMVSTDLLARGIDIPDLTNVIQFDFARNVVNHLLRSGRVSRAGSRGRVFNMYDDGDQGGKDLAEAIQELGTAPLDGLFSRRRGFRHMLQRTEAFRQMLLTQGLSLPAHLQAAPEPVPQLGLRSEAEAQAALESLEQEDGENLAPLFKPMKKGRRSLPRSRRNPRRPTASSWRATRRKTQSSTR
ncbi:unnamed protein product, partial [Effrenium voratum]